MLAIGASKLKLDDAVGGEEITLDGEAGGAAQQDDKTAKEVRKSLLTTLRNKFESGVGGKMEEVKEEDGDVEVKEVTDEKATPLKKARGVTASQAV